VKFAIVIAALGILLGASSADARTSKAVRCDKNHPHECSKLRKRARHLEAAVEWQKKQRAEETRDLLAKLRSPQPYAYAAQLAYLACVSFRGWHGDCRPPSEMLKVGRCESGLQKDDPNPVSTASNWMQFLDDTWARAPAGQLGFYKLDPLAVAIASEAKATSGWHEWRASIACHGLS
jgi:hypothetical protein